MKFTRFIYDLFNVFSKARKIREDEARRQKSVRFAVSAIIYSLVLFAMVFLGVFLYGITDKSGLLFIFVLVISIVLIIGGLLSFIGALLRVIAQFTINKSAMSWIALIVFLAALAASLFVTVYFIG